MGETTRLDELRRRIDADPASIAFATLAEEYRRAGRFEEAVETSRSGLRFHPAYVSARVTLGRSLVELGEMTQAERELRLVIRSSPENLAARRALGDLYWRQLDLSKALEQFQTAVTLAPGDDELAEIIQAIRRDMATGQAAAGAALPPDGPAESQPAESARASGKKVVEALERFYRGVLRVRAAGQGGGPGGTRATG